MNLTTKRFLTQINNAIRVKKLIITTIKSKSILSLLFVFLKKGLIRGYKEYGTKHIMIFLKYDYIGEGTINKIEVPKSTLKKNMGIINLKKIVKKRSDLYLYTTSKGILTLEECLSYNIGGFLVCIIR